MYVTNMMGYFLEYDDIRRLDVDDRIRKKIRLKIIGNKTWYVGRARLASSDVRPLRLNSSF